MAAEEENMQMTQDDSQRKGPTIVCLEGFPPRYRLCFGIILRKGVNGTTPIKTTSALFGLSWDRSIGVPLTVGW